MFKPHSIKWTISLVQDSKKYNYRYNERKVFYYVACYNSHVLTVPPYCVFSKQFIQINSGEKCVGNESQLS